VKFLLDECIHAGLVTLLAEAGHDVVHVVGLGMAGRPDIDVMATAREQGRVIITADTDFGELLATSGQDLPSVILFRQGNRRPEHYAVVIHSNLEAVTDDLAAGAVVTFGRDRIRIRKLPI
jgi:predicted nuclease of predicted toxin-antitoxin system